MRRTETPKPIWIKFCTLVDIPDVVTYTNFGDHRLRGFWVAGDQISPSPIDFRHRPYNTLACVISRPSAQSDGYFLVLEKGYSRDATADKEYVKRRGSAQGSAFWGSRNQNLRFGPQFFPKTAIFGLHFDGT